MCNGNILTINTKIGDLVAYFLLDTGANIALIDSNQLNKYLLEVENYNIDYIIGAGGKVSDVKKCKTPINILGTTLTDFMVTDLSSICNSLEKQLGVHILGLISCSLMQKIGLVIDFKNSEVRAEKDSE